MDESIIRAPQSDAWLVTMLDFLGDDQLVDLALAVGCERSSERDLCLKEHQYVRGIKGELLCRLQNSRRVRITMRD